MFHWEAIIQPENHRKKIEEARDIFKRRTWPIDLSNFASSAGPALLMRYLLHLWTLNTDKNLFQFAYIPTC